ELDLDAHPDPHGVGRAADDVRHEARALLELDDREHVGQALAKPGCLVLVRDREAVDGGAAARAHPLGRRREVDRAHGARREALRPAGAAALEVELVPREGLPVAAALLVDAREGLPVLAHAAPRSIVTPLWRCPSIPPVPCTSAISQSAT